MLQTLLVLLKKHPPEGRRLLVLGTTSALDVLEPMGMNEAFNVTLHVPPLKTVKEVSHVLKSLDAFDSEDLPFAVEALGSNPMPIKRLLMIVEMARQSVDNSSSNGYVKLEDWRIVLSDLTAVW